MLPAAAVHRLRCRQGAVALRLLPSCLAYQGLRCKSLSLCPSSAARTQGAACIGLEQQHNAGAPCLAAACAMRSLCAAAWSTLPRCIEAGCFQPVLHCALPPAPSQAAGLLKPAPFHAARSTLTPAAPSRCWTSSPTALSSPTPSPGPASECAFCCCDSFRAGLAVAAQQSPVPASEWMSQGAAVACLWVAC